MQSELDFLIGFTGQLFVLCFIAIVGYGFVVGLEQVARLCKRLKHQRESRLPAVKIRF